VFLRDLSMLSPAFEGRTVRVAVRGPAENARVVDAVAAAVAAGGTPAPGGSGVGTPPLGIAAR
jgi:hypothetical protein